MGLLDDAIREHLDLKRQHGAAEDELARQEAEALGPVTEKDIYAPSEGSGVGEPPLEREAGWPFDRVAEDELEDEPDAPSFAWSASSADEVEVPSFVPAEPLRDAVDDGENGLTDMPTVAFGALEAPVDERGDEPEADERVRPVEPEPPADISSETGQAEDLEGDEPTEAETEFLPPAEYAADEEAPGRVGEPEPLEEEPPAVDPVAEDRVEPPREESLAVEPPARHLAEPEPPEPRAGEAAPYELGAPGPDPEPALAEPDPRDVGESGPDPELGLTEPDPREPVPAEPEPSEPTPSEPTPPEPLVDEPELAADPAEADWSAEGPPEAGPREPLGDRIEPVPLEPEPIERVRPKSIDRVDEESTLLREVEPPQVEPLSELDQDHELPPEEEPSPFSAGGLAEEAPPLEPASLEPSPLEPAPEELDPLPSSTSSADAESALPEPPLPDAEQGQRRVASDDPLEGDVGPATEVWSIHDEPPESDPAPATEAWSTPPDEPVEIEPGPLTESPSVYEEPELEDLPPHAPPAIAAAPGEQEPILEPPSSAEERLDDPIDRSAEDVDLPRHAADPDPAEPFPAEPPAREQPPAARGFFEETEEHETLWREERPDLDPDFEN